MRVTAAVEKAIKEDAILKFIAAAAAAFKHCGLPHTAYVSGGFKYGHAPIRSYDRMPAGTLASRLKALEPEEGHPDLIVVEFTRNIKTEGYLAFGYDVKTGAASVYMGDGHRVGKFGVKSLSARAMATHFVKVIKVLVRYNAEIVKVAEALLDLENNIAPELAALKLKPGNTVDMVKCIHGNVRQRSSTESLEVEAASEPRKLSPDQVHLQTLIADPKTQALGTFLAALAAYLGKTGYAEGARQCFRAATSAATGGKVFYVRTDIEAVAPMLMIEKLAGGFKVKIDRFSGYVRAFNEDIPKIPHLVQALVQDVKDLDAGVEAGFQVFRGLEASRTKALFPDSDIRCDSTSFNTMSRYY